MRAIGENCDTGLNVCVGPYTNIGDKVKIINSEIENSIVIKETRIDCYKDRTQAYAEEHRGSRFQSSLPKGYKLAPGVHQR